MSQGRVNGSMNSGFDFQFCNISTHDGLLRAQANQTNKAAATQTFLGRLWKAYFASGVHAMLYWYRGAARGVAHRVGPNHFAA